MSRTAILAVVLVLLVVAGTLLSPSGPLASPPDPTAPAPEAEAEEALGVVAGGRAPGEAAGGSPETAPAASERRSVRRVTFCGGEGCTGCRDHGLEWLATSQAEDGSWEGRTSFTALSLLALLGSGETHKRGHHKQTVRNGLKHLKWLQSPGGRFGEGDDDGLATLAMCEAFALSGSPLFKQSARMALEAQLAAPWPDTSESFWRILALWSARSAKLPVPEGAEEAALAWLDRVTDAATGEVHCYTTGFPPETREACTAAGTLGRLLLGRKPAESAVLRMGLRAILDAAAEPERPHEAMFWWFGTVAAYRAGRDVYRPFCEGLKKAVVMAQVSAEDERGSWNPDGVCGAQLGRTGTTAVMLLARQTYYRYASVVGVR